MRSFDTAIESLGGFLLACGVLLAGMLGWKPGWLDLTDYVANPGVLWGVALGSIVLGLGLNRLPQIRANQQAQWVSIRDVGATGEMVLMDRPAPTKRDEDMPAPVATSRMCLQPVWPLRETSHWMGGLPQLPDGIDWPWINGKPASFLVQINLDALPKSLWHVYGPRNGALVFFGDGDTDNDIHILHVNGTLSERPQPIGASQHWDVHSTPAAMKLLNPDTGHVAPKWYLEITDQSTLGAVEDMAAENDAFWDSERGNWIWEEMSSPSKRNISQSVLAWHMRNGQDWRLSDAILATLATKLVRLEDKSRYRDETGSQSDNHTDAMAVLHDHRTQVAELMSEMRETSETTAFTPELGQSLKDLADTILADLAKRFNLHDGDFFSSLAETLENIARHAYCANPSTDSDPLVARYLDLWARQCKSTSVFLGTNADMPHGENTWERLLDIGPNPLTGLAIGDLSRLYVDIPAEDLHRRNWSAAYAKNTHGTY